MSMKDDLPAGFQQKANEVLESVRDRVEDYTGKSESRPSELDSQHIGDPGNQYAADISSQYVDVQGNPEPGVQVDQAAKKLSTKTLAFGGCALLLVICMLFFFVKACTSGYYGSQGEVPVTESVDLHLSIAYEENIIFAKYDIEVRIDSTKIGVVSQGETLEQVAPIKKGKHRIGFYRNGYSAPEAETEITVEEESYYECSLKAHTSSVDVNDERFESASAREARLAEEQAAKDKEEADRKAAEEEKERQRQEQDAEKQRLIDSLNSNVGKAASQAKDAAENLGCKVEFKDSAGEDVTGFYDTVAAGATIRNATVAEADFRDSFGTKTVTYKLDYTLPNSNSLEGKPLVETCKALEGEGVSFKIIGEHTRQDLTSIYQAGDYDNADMVITSARWKSKKDASMEIYTLSQSQLDEETAAMQTEGRLREVLHPDTAWRAVQSYGEAMYGSSFKAHYRIGLLAQVPIDEYTWFLKAECEVYGMSGNVEAKVTGTNDEPVVYDFVVY